MNNNTITFRDMEEKKGRKREAGKDFEEIVKPRTKKKKVVKKISREVKKVEEELKPGEEKVTHNQKSLGCQAKDLEQEETHEDPLTVNLACL